MGFDQGEDNANGDNEKEHWPGELTASATTSARIASTAAKSAPTTTAAESAPSPAAGERAAAADSGIGVAGTNEHARERDHEQQEPSRGRPAGEPSTVR